MDSTDSHKVPPDEAQSKSPNTPVDDAESAQIRFSPEEEADLVAESNGHKSEANALFASARYQAAVSRYDEAIAACPNYLDYELAVLRSNVAACHLKLGEWKDAVAAATAALDGLDRLGREEGARERESRQGGEEKGREARVGGDHGDARQNTNGLEKKKKEDEDEDVDEEIISAGASKAAAPAVRTSPDPDQDDAAAKAEEEKAEARRKRRGEDIARIRAKALMRRARARSEQGGWSNLAGAEEDYKALVGLGNLGAADRRVVQAQLRALPARTKAAQEAETAEMWGKLKDLGNGLLKPFGLSTDNFQMVKDENTGGYSMNFKQ